MKFDTTVIPGSNTRERAFVRVTLVVKDPFKIDQDKLERLPDGVDKKELDPHVHAFYTTPISQAFSPGSVLHGSNRLYQDWLASIGDRLNTHMATKFRSDDFMAQCKNTKGDKTKMDQLIKEGIRENIELVLGTVSKRIHLNIIQEFSSYKVDLPDPWGKFMSLYYKETTEGSGCNVSLIFDVAEKWDTVYVFKKDKRPASPESGYEVFADTPKERLLAFKKASSQKGNTGNTGDSEPYYPSYPNDAVIDLKCKKHDLEGYWEK